MVRHFRSMTALISIALAMAGCATPDGSQSASATAARAGYVQLMLGNAMGTTALGEGGVDDVVMGYGGGIVLSVSVSGVSGTPDGLHIVDVALGVTAVTDHVQDETYGGATAIQCYRFTIGYYSYLTSYSPISCPALGSATSMRAAARRWDATMTAAESLFTINIANEAVPVTLAAVRHLLGSADLPIPAGNRRSAIGPARQPQPGDFAAGSTWSALAVPLTNGGCVYVSFRVTTDENPQSVGLGNRALTGTGWAAPEDAACNGTAALEASVQYSADPYAGG